MVIRYFDWLLIISSNLFIITGVYLALSRLGKIRLGGENARTEFSSFAWYSMLISAGMGIGLMFWAVAEPLIHFDDTPPVFESSEAGSTALATTFFHWGLHPWGVYTLMALSLAYFAFNQNLPLSLRSVFYPLFKTRIYGFAGDIIDSLAVLSTLFGLATSLGLGIMQINSGLNYLLNINISTGIQVGLILLVTLFAAISVASGINNGVKFLSKLNIKLVVIFVLAIFLLGPTIFIVNLFSNSLGLYIGNFTEYSFYISLHDKSWQAEWSVFYLGWWIAWSPFVGMFIARISKGRTVREFVFGVLIIPSLLSFFWLSAMGGTAIFLNDQGGGALINTVEENYPVALFKMVEFLNIPVLTELVKTSIFVLAIILVVSYFVTSSDSGSLVASKISSGGRIRSPVKQRVIWALLEGLIAATLLIIGGEKALYTLQTVVIIAGLPLAIILTIMIYTLITSMKNNYYQ